MKATLSTILRLPKLVNLRISRRAVAQSGVVIEGTVTTARHVRLRATDGGEAHLLPSVSIDRFADITVKHGRLDIGARTYVGQFSVICAREWIFIGDDCLIAEHVTIRDQDHRFGSGLVTARAGFTTAPIIIGDNVWIGAKATITKGVTIGGNSVIGANSVVTRDIPPNVVAAGAPARVLREITLGDRADGGAFAANARNDATTG